MTEVMNYAKILESLERRKAEIFEETRRQIARILDSEADNLLNIEASILKYKKKIKTSTSS